jgi:hypothetical protein
MKSSKSLLTCGFILFFATLLFAAPLFAGTAELSWEKPTTDANGDPLTAFIGYKIYYGTSPRTDTAPPGGYPNSVAITDPDQLTYFFSSLPDDFIYYFSVVAYNGAGESSFSNEAGKYICSNNNAKIDDRGYYSTAQSAYNALNEGETAKLLAVSFPQDLLLDEIKSVNLQGGFNCAYTSASGFSVVIGSVTINKGSVAVENIIIR